MPRLLRKRRCSCDLGRESVYIFSIRVLVAVKATRIADKNGGGGELSRHLLYRPPGRIHLMSAKKNTGLYVAALALFLVGVGYLLFTGFNENGVYFRNVSEALAMPRDELRATRLFGTVKAEGIQPLEQELGVRFQLEDKDNAALTMWVLYKGAVPDTFKAGVEVIVEGGFEAVKGDDFQARTLMTKCPSKYQKENRG